MVYCYICTSYLKEHEKKHLLIRKQDVKKNKVRCHECKFWIKLFEWNGVFPNARVPEYEEMNRSYRKRAIMERIYLKRKEEEKRKNKWKFMKGEPKRR